VPHAINIAFSGCIKNSGFSIDELKSAGGNSFMKQYGLAKRVVSQNPGIYYEIQSLNDETGSALASFKKEVEKMEHIVNEKKRKEFIENMKSCMTYIDR
jgi:prephenate dehydrogenase